jgi:predicted CXXCH cytochrome family protein
MRCITCHDPHRTVASETAAGKFNLVCRQCHSNALASLVASANHTREADCVGCHMPKRRTDDVVHAVMTDHRIQRRLPQGDLLAPISERPADSSSRDELVAYEPKLGQTSEDALNLAAAQAGEVINRDAGVVRLQELIRQNRPERAKYYLALADALEADGNAPSAIRFYDEAARRRPGSIVILGKLCAALFEAGQLDRAMAATRSLIARDVNNPQAWDLLGQINRRKGRSPEAAVAFRKALAADPDRPEARNNLGSLLAASGDLTSAEKEFRESMRIMPRLAEAHSNLAGVLVLRQDLDQAAYYFQRAIELKPNYASARLEYARMLNSLGQYAAAETQVESAVRADPNLAEAHELWGILLAGRGLHRPAVREFEFAVGANPASSDAQLYLGAALVIGGELKEGLAHLRLALQSTNPEVQRAALELLKKYGSRN